MSAFLGTAHTHLPLRTCHLSRALAGSGLAGLFFLWVPKNSFPLPDSSLLFSSRFYLRALKGIVVPPLPSASSPQGAHIFRKQKRTSLEARTVFLGSGEYSENKTSIDVLITIQLLFFTFNNSFSLCSGFKDCPQIL